ncbi:hypothetical protein [Streptomyces sp. NBC_01750]|uniref:hypothetical protein n=1 Tax=Streptomyces sp. NBC_01750 TaxID=2975928 RepID=UPI002DDA7B9C|nr:hypothetical protein [Streptomyces sp. NBC_01750]WSD36558.1 hypothetical protein OG966_34415 [Streptomyces sp. NBC_01750]
MTENRSRGAMDSGDEPPTPTPTQTQAQALDELLAAAARPAPAAPEAEERAVAAFRTARDEGGPTAPTRRMDDWRPVAPRIGTRWIKVGLGTLVAGLALGGVAMAAGAIPTPFGDTLEKPGPRPGASSPQDMESPGRVRPSGPVPSAAGPAARPPGERPPTAQDQLAQCRVYGSKQGPGRALDSTARQRLENAAGGPGAVAAYCARLLSEQPLKRPPRTTPSPDEKKDPPVPAGQPKGPEQGGAPGQRPPWTRAN